MRMVKAAFGCDRVGETDCGDDAEVDGVAVVVLMSSEIFLPVPVFAFSAAGVYLRFRSENALYAEPRT